MMIKFTTGNMFEVDADILINTVNCVGVMGAGVALAFKNKYPDMYKEYKQYCNLGLISPGKLHIWNNDDKTIINFPTKRNWRNKSKYEDIQSGLLALKEYLSTVGSSRVALPALGCGHGGLDWKIVSKMISDNLGDIDLDIIVFEPKDSRNIAIIENSKNENLDVTILKEMGVSEVKGYKELGFKGNQYILGDEKLFINNSNNNNNKVVFVLDAKKAKAKRAFVSIIEAIKESEFYEKNVLMIYRSNADIKIIDEFLSNGFSVTVLLPFGFLPYGTKVVKQFKDIRNILFISPYDAFEKWNDRNVLDVINTLINNGYKILSTDESPLWLDELNKKTNKLNNIYLIKYKDTVEYISKLGLNGSVKLIGKSTQTGKLNLHAIYTGNSAEPHNAINEYKLTYEELKKVMLVLASSDIENEFEFIVKFKNDPLISLSIIENILKNN